MLLLIMVVILFELIVLVGGVYFTVKYFSKIKFSSNNITSNVVHDGVKSAMQEITYEEQKNKLHKKKMEIPTPIYSTLQHDTPVISDGDLIPYGLTEKEKATLEMFYNSD
jgi:uncharacterized protein YneF (UPF0154 family)